VGGVILGGETPTVEVAVGVGVAVTAVAVTAVAGAVVVIVTGVGVAVPVVFATVVTVEATAVAVTAAVAATATADRRVAANPRLMPLAMATTVDLHRTLDLAAKAMPVVGQVAVILRHLAAVKVGVLVVTPLSE